jgi:multidrug efflux pump subunit AcrA (membrane-fusion protein)
MSKQKAISLALLGGALILTSLLAACGGNGAAGSNSSGEKPATAAGPVEVTAVAAVDREIPAFIEATGNLEADEESEVAPQTSGQVAATPVNVGAFVRQGDVLARLNDRDARLRLQQAQASEQQAVVAVRQAEAKLGLGSGERFDASSAPEVRAARETYEAALAQARLAEANERRYANLVETGDTSRLTYDQYRTQAETSRREANAARQQLENAQNIARQNNQSIASARAALDGARSQVGLAQKTVNDTIVRAPFAGYISERTVGPGEYVTPASRIVTLVRTNPIKLSLQLPETDAGRVRLGMNVSVTVAAYADRQFAGQVTAINPSLDPTSRSVIVEARLDNSQNMLRPNMFAATRIVMPGGGRGVFVPAAAVVTDQTTNSSRVFVIERDTARVRVVQLGERENDWARIVIDTIGGGSNQAVNTASIYVKLKPIEERSLSQQDLMVRARELLKNYPKQLRVSVQPVASIRAQVNARPSVRRAFQIRFFN